VNCYISRKKIKITITTVFLVIKGFWISFITLYFGCRKRFLLQSNDGLPCSLVLLQETDSGERVIGHARFTSVANESNALMLSSGDGCRKFVAVLLLAWASEGVGGPWPSPGIRKFQKKRCLLSFEWKNKISPLLAPHRKILEKSPSGLPLEKILPTPMITCDDILALKIFSLHFCGICTHTVFPR